MRSLPRPARPLALATSALALCAMGTVGVAASTDTPAAPPAAAPAVSGEVALAALPELTFPAGVYMENRVSDHVNLPPGTVLVFQGLPPGLTYDGGTTAIRGVPTTPGVYRPVATAYIGGIPVRTESTKVTITGQGSAPAPSDPRTGGPAPAPAPAPAAPPAPGTIDIAMIQGLALPQPVKDFLLGAAQNINNGIQAAWAAVPAGSLGK